MGDCIARGVLHHSVGYGGRSTRREQRSHHRHTGVVGSDGVVGQRVSPHTHRHYRVGGEGQIQLRTECVVGIAVRQNDTHEGIRHRVGTGTIVQHQIGYCIRTEIGNRDGHILVTQSAARLRQHGRHHVDVHQRRCDDTHSHSGIIALAAIILIHHPLLVRISEEHGRCGRRDIPVADTAVEAGTDDTGGILAESQSRTVPDVRRHTLRGPLGRVGSRTLKYNRILNHTAVTIDEAHFGVIGEGGSQARTNSDAAVGNAVADILQHQRLARLNFHIPEDVHLVVETRRRRHSHNGVSGKISRCIADVRQLHRSLTVVFEPVGYRTRQSNHIVSAQQLHLRDTHYRHRAALTDIIGGVVLQRTRDEGGADIDGLRRSRVAVPVD